MERGLSILWIDAICGSVQNSMTPPEKNVVGRVSKPTLYERGCHRPIFPHHWLKQSACCQSIGAPAACATQYQACRSALVMALSPMDLRGTFPLRSVT
jgi:hypothetical protein